MNPKLQRAFGSDHCAAAPWGWWPGAQTSSPLLVVLVLAVALVTFSQSLIAGGNEGPGPRAVVGEFEPGIKNELVGAHTFSFHWVTGCAPFGFRARAFPRFFGFTEVSEDVSTLRIQGSIQAEYTCGTGGFASGGWATIDGIVLGANRDQFLFEGRIETFEVGDREACVREGRMTFTRYEHPDYWRLTAMRNPCSSVANYTDYIDIFLRFGRVDCDASRFVREGWPTCQTLAMGGEVTMDDLVERDGLYDKKFTGVPGSVSEDELRCRGDDGSLYITLKSACDDGDTPVRPVP